MYTEEELLDLATLTMIIYKITNLINGKIYIGQTIRTFNKRYNGAGIGAERVLRYFEINKDNKKNEHLNNALIKYGTNNFKVEIICKCNTIEELNEKEEYYIDLYKARDYKKGYNCEEGGDNKRKSIDWRIDKLLENENDRKYFRELFKNKKVDKHEILKLISSPVVYIEKNGAKKYYKYYYYSDLRICCREHDISVEDGFCMAMRKRVKTRYEKTFYHTVSISKQQIVFRDDIEIIYTEFEGFKNKDYSNVVRTKTKTETKKKRKNVIHYKKCPLCGKQINSRFKMCADCKRSKEEGSK